ncbi:ATP-binding cassette domain-containing protein [Actinomyces sp. oral taxon 170]|uniref:ATP-binding cassette domain-containing protein n=1 Tax=Actinomyces sp. oral taxon 170 TaxID=712117 RepID=UPI00209EFC39|nr:ATP-binding cassette domain-containing protein [Actinomyces sp. oral taxon 170]
MTIVLRSLVVRSDGTMLVDGVELSLAPGSRTALVGASGAGKSLTCAALAGTLPAGLETSGSLTVEADGAGASAGSRTASGQGGGGEEGVNLLGLPAAQRPRNGRIALVSQDHSTALHPLIPVGRQIALAARAGGCRPGQGRRRAEEMLRAVGLEAALGERVPGRLSGGQRQRAALALALAARPSVLIADEPTTALDVLARAEILDLLTRLTSADAAGGSDGTDSAQSVQGTPDGPALLLITHDLPAAAICDNVVVLHDGAVIERGPTAQVLAHPEHPVTVAMCEAAAGETIDGALAAAVGAAA